MFNWTAIPDSIDNNYEEAESSPSISSSAATFALHSNTNTQILTRSVSTSHISSSSHHDQTNHPVSSSLTRPHYRTPGAGSLSEFSSPVMAPASKLLSSSKTTSDQISSGLRTLPNSNLEPLTGHAGAFGGGSAGAKNLPSLLDPPASNPCWWFPQKSASLPDFVLISEFSEVEGPRAVMTIPDSIVDLTRDSYSSNKQRAQESSPRKHTQQTQQAQRHTQDLSDMSSTTLGPEGRCSTHEREDLFDIHEFVLRITSVDQQVREASGSFHIPEDTEVHISDGEKGYWAYVHHFTLFDINARGFVRPFSMSYITRDPHKILTHYEEMRHKFSKAALHFKTGNYTLFRQDLTKRLRDLNFTNNLLSEAPPEPLKSADMTFPATVIPSASPPFSNLQSYDTTLTPPESARHSPPYITPLNGYSLSSTTSHDTIAASPNQVEAGSSESMTESQKTDLESIKDAIETATHIISTLEHYSVDGQPLLGHADDGNESVLSTVPLSDLSPMTSSENLAALATARIASTDPSLFLGATSRTGSRIRRKNSASNMSAAIPSRVFDGAGLPAHLMDGLSAPLPQHLLGLQQEQSRKNSVVSEYDSMLYEAPEYEAQYATTLYPIFRDEVTFRPLRELCIATMVWNSSIQFHLGIKKLKDILKDFQAFSQLLGEAADSIKRMYPTSSSLTVGHRMSTRQTHYQPTSVPFMELLEGISLANMPLSDDGILTNAKARESNIEGHQEREMEIMAEKTPAGVRRSRAIGGTLDADDADDEETGYDSLDDAASFFTAATGMATHVDIPTREAFIISPLERSSRVAEWHQEQQTIHRAKGATVIQPDGLQEQGPWTFGVGVTMAETTHVPSSRLYCAHRHSAQSGASLGIAGTPSLHTASSPTTIVDTLQRDPTLAKHLVFALLSGQRLCVMGQAESETNVRGLVSVLSTFLPHAGFPSKEEQLGEHQQQIITWFQGSGLLRIEDMVTPWIVGVDSSRIDPKFLESNICILDYDTLTWVHGRQYMDGMLLEPIFRNLSVFTDDTSFLAFFDAKLFEILLKSFLYYHLVFHGRLYQGGSLLALPGAQSFYSSGASDDGEAFSYQSNFRSARQSPMGQKSIGLSRNQRNDTSAHSKSTYVGATVAYKNMNARSLSLSSYESSDAEKPGHRALDLRNRVAQDYCPDLRNSRIEPRGGIEMEEDESNHNEGPMQYTTSQGMRKWKKWFEYWSAKSAAMIDPALAAFGRSDVAAHPDSFGDTSGRRRRNISGRASPGHVYPAQHSRKSRLSSSHTNPARNRDAKERDKERDRERDRERSRKSTFDPFDVTSKEKTGLSDYDSGLRCVDEKYLEVVQEKDVSSLLSPSALVHPDHQPGKVDESQESIAPALAPITMSRFKESSAVSGLRKLKPKRPLTLHQRSFSNSSDREQEKSDIEAADGQDGGGLIGSVSSGSAPGPSPPTSATFRSLAEAIRAMSFGPPSRSKDNLNDAEVVSTQDVPSLLSINGHGAEISPRNSRDLSDSYNKDVKRRGSTRAKAKAWFRAKRKKHSRGGGGDDLDGVTTGGSRQSNEMVYNDDLSEEEEDEVGSFLGLSYDSDTEDQECRHRTQQQPQEVPFTGASAPQILSVLSPRGLKDMSTMKQPSSAPTNEHNTESNKSNALPATKDTDLTIEEIAAQEPTRTQPRANIPLSSTCPSAPPTTAASGYQSVACLVTSASSNSSSRISSTNASRITAPTLATSFTTATVAAGRQRSLQSQPVSNSMESQRTAESISTNSVITVGRGSYIQSRASLRGGAGGGGNETRSEPDDSEHDRRDLGRESATEYETSQETFPITDGNRSPALEGQYHNEQSPPQAQYKQQLPQSQLSGQHHTHHQHFVQQHQLQAHHQNHHYPPSRILPSGSTASRLTVPQDTNRRISLERPASQSSSGGLGGGMNSGKERSTVHSRLTVDTAAAANVRASVVAGVEYTRGKKDNYDTVTLTEEDECIVKEMIGGVTGADDWSVIVYLATMIDEYERSKEPVATGSSEP
ncbi:hypothetical protein BG004_006061 [Podila humilis]|nr:hypothetical protein BG004_006061 [Podila humilis]